MSDDDFIDVAATMASGSIGGSASGDGALRALSGSLHGGGAGGGRMSTATTTTSTSSQHLDRQSSPPAPASSSRRGWFSSLFGGAGAAIPAAVQAARSKTVIDHPDLSVTYASSFPDRLRLIKTVHLFPLQLKLKADYVRAARDVQVGCSVRDSILGGSLRVDAATRTLSYHKRLPLSLGGGSSGPAGAHVGIFAGISYDGLLPLGSRGDATVGDGGGGGLSRPRPPPFSVESLRPSLTFRYELGGGGAVWTGDAFALRHRFRVSKGLGLEVRGSARLPAPKAELRVGGGGNQNNSSNSRISLGEGGAHLHVEEVNLVFHL